MKIHYFQRYHKGEDVATANAMLLLSRLYSYSSDLFFQFLKEQFFCDMDFEPEISFDLQVKNKDSVPDAIISQPSFKIVIETKLFDWFKTDQLIRHLNSFGNEEYKVLITLAPELLGEKKKLEIDAEIKQYNAAHKTSILHINTTFELLAKFIQETISDRDYEMQAVLEDYLDYCYNDKLIIVPDAWKKLRMQLAGATLDFNLKENVYYDSVDRGFSPHDYLGLYKQKSVRAIGKIDAIITAVVKEGELHYQAEVGELTEERKEKINLAIEDGKNYQYTLDNHRYFFVEKFYETDFRKVSPRPPMGTRVFDLAEVLQLSEMPDTETLAELLRTKTWL